MKLWKLSYGATGHESNVRRYEGEIDDSDFELRCSVVAAIGWAREANWLEGAGLALVGLD